MNKITKYVLYLSNKFTMYILHVYLSTSLKRNLINRALTCFNLILDLSEMHSDQMKFVNNFILRHTLYK